MFPVDSQCSTHLQTTLYALLCQQHTGPLLSISGLYKWTDCHGKKKKKERMQERNGERQTESGMRQSKNIHRKLPQAESWRQPS